MKSRLSAILLCMVSVGCVSQGKYDDAVAESQRVREHAARTDAARVTELSRLQRDLASAKKALAELERRLGSGQREMDEATALNASLRAELERLGQNVDKLLADRGALGSALDDARKRLDELRRAQTAAEGRAALFRSLALKLKKMIDARELSIVLRDGRMVLVLPNDVLFDSGKAKLKADGRRALEQVGAALATVPDRDFQVAGHTDNEPIRLSGFASNWELSTARALEVVSLLVNLKIRPELLSAAGYAEFDPVGENASAEGRAKNRRIEITLQPNIDELVAVP